MIKTLSTTFFCLFFTSQALVAESFPKWHQETESTLLKKEGFLRTLLPIIESENKKIAQERDFLERFFEKDFFYKIGYADTNKELARLASLAKKYKISKLYDKNSFLSRVDTVPVSMALAQAALESSWGRSGYAKNKNNIYGHYIFKGFEQYGEGKKIKKFSNLNDAVSGYMTNINTHQAYTDFRALRSKYRANSMEFGGVDAIKTLNLYSEIGKEYTKLLAQIIYSNNFQIFDTQNSNKEHYISLLATK